MHEFFNTSFGLRIAASQVVEEIIRFMRADDKKKYKVIVGTDSLWLADKNVDFVTAIVVLRVGNGGRYFWKRLDFGKFHTLRDRIIKEALVSIETAQNLLLELKKYSDLEWEFEIHVDIGENGPTKAMIQEVVGMVRANNFEAKTKPDSYAASKVADRHV